MRMVTPCQTAEDFQQLLRDSQERPVFLFKHSTRCPISAAAWQRFLRFAEESGSECWQVLVIEQRPLSHEIALASEVTHQSPQAILYRHGRAVWDASHGSITVESLRQALQAHGN